MALKKPSDLFNKIETSGMFQLPEVSLHVSESYDKFLNNFEKVNELSLKVEDLSNQLSEKLSRTELENAMLSQLMVLDENFKTIQNQVKGLNKQDLKEFKEAVYNLTQVVDNLVESELPRYKKQVTKSELFVGGKVNQLQEIVEENINNIREEIDTKLDNVAEVVDNNIEYFNQQLQINSSQIKKTTETYTNLSKIIENKISNENERLEEYSQIIENLQETFKELKNSLSEENNSHQEKVQNIIEEKIENVSSSTNKRIDNFTSNVDNKVQTVFEKVNDIQNQVISEISNLKAEVVIFEKHNKDTEKTILEFSNELSRISKFDKNIEKIQENVKELKSEYKIISDQSSETKKDLEVVERYIQTHHQDIEILKEEVFAEIEKLPVDNLQENIQRLERKIDNIKEIYSKIEPEVVVKEVIKEGILNEPSETKNSDTLTPLNQNFVTLEQLQEHYRLFINRIQQQLSTLGGGGETRLKYLDDIVGIATNSSAYDGKYLKYNHSLGTFEFSDVDITIDSWADGINGPYTYANVGIGTSITDVKLDIIGNARISGVITATDFNSTSDISLKENVKLIENPINTVMKIDGVSFNWKETGQSSLGVIAQQLEETLPQLIHGDEIKTVNYNGLIGLLIEVVKEQQKQINELKDRLDK